MKALTLEITKENSHLIPLETLRQALIDAEMWKPDDRRDPTKDIAAAWVLVKKMTRKRGQGIDLSMGVTDALNGYGRLERWYAIYQEYEETCTKCEENPDHYGNCRYKREWVHKTYATAYDVEEAICRLALAYALDKSSISPIE